MRSTPSPTGARALCGASRQEKETPRTSAPLTRTESSSTSRCGRASAVVLPNAAVGLASGSDHQLMAMHRDHVMRVARPTDNLPAIADMYARGLGFTILAQFSDHEGFDGVILGHPRHAY